MLKKLIRYLTDKDYRFVVNGNHSFYKNMPDEEYLKKRYQAITGETLDLSNPQKFNEKLQWLKLYDRKPIYSTMVDKYAAKQYVAGIIGEEHIIPTLGVWDNFDDIDFSSLPDQFVLKCTHDSGGLVICKDKSCFDKEAAKNKIKKCLKRNFYWAGREWPYKSVKPRIIAEKYMEDATQHELRDYKFFCFSGEVKAMFVATERQDETVDTKFDFFDENYCHLPFQQGHPNAKRVPEKPCHFDLMKKLATKLSEGIPHVRVDFYECNGKVYFGEYTFFHYSGFVPFVPEEWDFTFGKMIHLPVDC